MVTQLHTAWVGPLLDRLPRPLLAALDAWARRRATRRAAVRRARAAARKAAAVAAVAPPR
jgi:hypothetical protein